MLLVDGRAWPTAVRFSKFGCNLRLALNSRYPLAGLDPATHVFLWQDRDGCKTWMAGSSPAKGMFWDQFQRKRGRNRPCNAEPDSPGSTRASTAFRRTKDVGAHGSSPWAEGPRVKPGHGAFQLICGISASAAAGRAAASAARP